MAVVLIVEDDEQVSVMSESILRDAGHTVIAATGAEGTAALLAIKQISIFCLLTSNWETIRRRVYGWRMKPKRRDQSFPFFTRLVLA